MLEKLAELIISLFKEALVKELIHKCSYLPGPMNFTNIYFNIYEFPINKLISTGLWKCNLKIIHKTGRIGTIAVAVEVSPEIKGQ